MSGARATRPSGITPFDAFDEDSDSANALGVSHSHPQGFVRANRPGAMYVGSHSRYDRTKPGTIFVVRQDSSGKKYLAARHRTRHKHPSGVHMLGRYVVYGDRQSGRSQLRVIDLNRRLSRHDITHELPEITGPTRRYASWAPRGTKTQAGLARTSAIRRTSRS